MPSSRLLRLSLSALLLLTACSTQPVLQSSHPGASGISGSVFGGQQPVSGATIQLYATGTTGDGSASTPLLTQPVVSDASGAFNITGLYSCPANSLVYLTATGGNPSPSLPNPDLAMMTALGPCSKLTPSTFILVDERTSVAAVAALAPFMSSFSAIGSSSFDLPALTSAFTLAAQLVNPSDGSTPGLNVPSGVSVPSALINTLADILASCINSTGGTSGDSSSCGRFFALTTPTGATPPTDTAAALLSLARNPALNSSALFNLSTPGAPFQPQLTQPPTSFAIGLQPAAGQPSLQFSVTSFTFPTAAVSFTSPVQTISLTNSGSAPAEIDAITLLGPNSADFSQVSNCASPLAAGASCTVQLTVTPAAAGQRSAFLAVSSNPSTSPAYLPLSVIGAAPSAGPAKLSASSLTYTYAGTYQDIQLQNFGTTPLNVKSIATSTSNFVVGNQNCTPMLLPQSICTISVEAIGFQLSSGPSYPPTLSDTLVVTDDAAGGSQTAQLTSMDDQRVSITAAGIVQVGSSLALTGMVSGRYHEAQAYFMGAISGVNASDFSPSPAGCIGPGGIPQSEACNFTVTFTPSGPGLRTARITFGNAYVPLLGYGQDGATAYFTAPSSLGLMADLTPAGTAVASASIIISNTGSTTLKFPSFPIFSPTPSLYSVSGSTCTSVAPGATCTVTVTLTGSALGTSTASLTLLDSASAISKTVTLLGTIRYAPVVATPYILNIYNVPVGTTSAPQSVTITDDLQRPLGHALSATLEIGTAFAFVGPTTCPASTTQTCSFSFTYTPIDTVFSGDTVTITDQVSGNTGTLYLQGTGVYVGNPAVSLSSSSITFPARPTGSTSLPTAITLTNSGTAPLNVKSITFAGAVNQNFSQTNNCTSLLPAATCTINITYAPTASGPQSATIQIISNAPTSPDIISVSGTTTN